MLKLLPLADILKLSEEELTLLTGETGLDTGTAALAVQGPALILISLAERGAYFRRGALCGLVPAFQVDTVDTTGAGDAFLGAILHRLRHKTLEEIRRLGEEELRGDRPLRQRRRRARHRRQGRHSRHAHPGADSLPTGLSLCHQPPFPPCAPALPLPNAGPGDHLIPGASVPVFPFFPLGVSPEGICMFSTSCRCLRRPYRRQCT